VESSIEIIKIYPIFPFDHLKTSLEKGFEIQQAERVLTSAATFSCILLPNPIFGLGFS
jgi:hypothetical protein